MKKYSLYIASIILVCLGILAYSFGFNLLPGLSPDTKVVVQNPSAASDKTLTDNLDSIPDYIEPEDLKSTLSAEQKKQYSKLNETQQKEALSAMGHQQGIKEMVRFGEVELNRLEELDKEIAQKGRRAEEIIQTLNAKVDAKKGGCSIFCVSQFS